MVYIKTELSFAQMLVYKNINWIFKDGKRTISIKLWKLKINLYIKMKTDEYRKIFKSTIYANL